MEPRRTEQSLGELFARLSRELLFLVRQEVEFAKEEMGRKARRAAIYGVLIALGGGFAFAGLLVLLFIAVVLLAEVLPLAIAGIIVGILASNTGLLLITLGYWKLKKERLLPERTVELLQEEGEWVKSQVA